MRKLVAVVKVMMTLALMSFSFIIFFIALVSADEQAVAVDVDVSDSIFSWVYSDGVKEKVVGSVVTLLTIFGSVGIYYLVKVF